MVKSKTGENPYSGIDQDVKQDQSVNRSSSFRKASDSLDHYGKSDLNNILSGNKEEDIKSIRAKSLKSGDKYALKEPTNFLFKETFDQ